MAKTAKLIIETSCVPVALYETTRAHRAHFDSQIGDGELWSSVYIRKEFIRRWIRDYISAAMLVEHFGTVSEALAHIEQSFAARELKGGLHVIAALLQEKGLVTNAKAVGKEIGRLAIGKLKKFDLLFRRRISNSCGCQVGAKPLRVDHNRFFEDLQAFIDATDDFPNCPVNDFLNFSSVHGRARRLLSHPAAAATKAGDNLARLVADGARVDCAKCARIGDAVISLEQPKSWQLVHIDHDFAALCDASGRQHRPVKSQRASERELDEAK